MTELDNLLDNENTQTGNEFPKEEWIKQKIESREEAYVMLEIATEELVNPDSVMAYLDIQSRFDRYSVSNSLLIASLSSEPRSVKIVSTQLPLTI